MKGNAQQQAERRQNLELRKERALASIAISSVIGASVKLVQSGNEYKGLCPFHPDRTIGSFSVNDKKAMFKCFSCGEGGNAIDFLIELQNIDFIEALRRLESQCGLSADDVSNPELRERIERQRAERERAVEADNERRRGRARRLWMGAEPIGRDGVATPALGYLISRGLDFRKLGKVPGALRWRPDIGHREFKGQKDNRHPAMIAGIYSLSGQIIGCHRTYLDISQWDHGRKCGPVGKMQGVEDAKVTLGPSLGGHIPIWKGVHPQPLRDIPAGTDIYISEGIEDGGSVAIADPSRRVIAGVSLSKLGAIALPPQMGRLVFIGQNDPSGSAAADAFASAIEAHQDQGRDVHLMMPPAEYKDFNDVLMGKPIQGGR